MSVLQGEPWDGKVLRAIVMGDCLGQFRVQLHLGMSIDRSGRHSVWDFGDLENGVADGWVGRADTINIVEIYVTGWTFFFVSDMV